MIRCRARTVHPHARGEQAFFAAQIGVNSGSSPRSWGTGHVSAARDLVHRFIPTLVGNSQQVVLMFCHPSVHPHARGEQEAAQAEPWPVGGSSPRSWGTAAGVDDVSTWFRFIPTLVGNSDSALFVGHHWSVHPHARGEQGHGAAFAAASFGSSPRSWGTVVLTPEYSISRRFIPTLVRNSKVIAAELRIEPVHPHARGEQRRRFVCRSSNSGSSPRSWGTVPIQPSRRSTRRFIPTLVGNRAMSMPKQVRSSVHPHARGEQKCQA